MTYCFLAAYSISFFIGYLLISLIFNKCRLSLNNNDIYMRLVLSLPLGMGISSLISFYSLLLCARTIGPVIIIIHLLVLGLLFILNNKNPVSPKRAYLLIHKPIGVKWLVIILALLSYVLIHIVPYFLRYPYGLWDAFACWNMRARFIFLSQDWLRVFSPQLFATDYPLLLPLNIAWGWIFSDRNITLVPIFVAIIYTFSVILLTFLAVARYFGLRKALLATLFLITITSFLKVAGSQYGDMALSCYNSIGVISCFIAIREKRLDYMILGQIALGLGVLTKHEGFLIFIAVNSIIYLRFAFKNRELIKMFLRGLEASLFMLITLGIFKQLAYNSYKVFSIEDVTPGVFLDKTRLFLTFFCVNVLKIPLWSLFWFVFLSVVILFHKKMLEGVRSIIFLTSFFVFLGYFIVFIFKIEPPLQNLTGTYERLIVHFLPMLVFLIADILFEKNNPSFK